MTDQIIFNELTGAILERFVSLNSICMSDLESGKSRGKRENIAHGRHSINTCSNAMQKNFNALK